MPYSPIVGVGPFGVGTPIPAGPPAAPVLGSSRQLGTGREDRGQYVMDGDNPAFDLDVRQLAVIAIMTTLGSSIVQGLGRGAEPPIISQNFDQEKRAQIEAALDHLVKAKLLRIEFVKVVEIWGGRTFTHVRIADLTQNQPFDLRLS